MNKTAFFQGFYCSLAAKGAWIGLFALCFSVQAQPVRVLFETGLGEIVLELDAVHAPRTVENFLRYVDAGSYTGGVFHRTVTMQNQDQSPVKIEVIQAGPGAQAKSFGPIALERSSKTGLQHKDGVLSMARSGPDTATSDIFICIGNQPELDFGGKRNPDGQGFAAFGVVVKGMDVVRKIQSAPADGQKLKPPIAIKRAVRIP